MRTLLLAMLCAAPGDPPPVPSAAPIPAASAPVESRAEVDAAVLERIALGSNPTIAQAAERIEEARGRAIQAGAYPNPLIIWGANDLGSEGTVGTQRGLFQQPIITGGKLRANRARYEVDVEVARCSLARQRLLVSNGVRLRALRIVGLQRMLDLRGGLAKVADDVVRTTREKVDSGHADEADLLTAQTEADLIALELDAAEARLRNSWRELAAFVGRPDLPPTRLAGDLAGEVRPMDWDAALARLLAESPDVRIAALQVRRQELTLRRERIEPIPDLVLRAGAAQNPTIPQTVGYTQLYVEVPLWDRNKGNIHAAEHGLEDVRKDLDRVRLGLQQRLARTYNHHQTSLANLAKYRDEILPRARRAFELYRDSFRREDGNFSRVQSSQSAYGRAALKYMEELLELRLAEAAVDGLLVHDQSIEVDELRPPSSNGLAPPGEGLPAGAAGGGVPVGRPTRDESS